MFVKISPIEDATCEHTLRVFGITDRISLVGPEDRYLVEENIFPQLITQKTFEFDDVTEKYEDTGSSLLVSIITPTKQDIENIIDHLQELIAAPRIVKLLIHCHAGISRSPAVAMIAFYLMYKDAKAAKEELLRIRPMARPNGLMIRYADEILTIRSGIPSNMGDTLGLRLRWDSKRRIDI